MKLYPQQDDQGAPRRARRAKHDRARQHRAERRAARRDPELRPTSNHFAGYAP